MVVSPAMRKTSLVLYLAVAAACGGDDSDTKVTTIKPGASAAADVQAALINAKPGDTLFFEEGVYMFSEELSLTVSGVTLRGQPDRTKVVLDFSQQTAGNANGFSARGVTGLLLENLTIRDSKGDAVRVQDSKNITIRNVKVYWTRGSATDNGAYGLYPVFDENILIEDTEIVGASDAGIYVGQSKTAVVRRCTVRGNMTGIEIENTDDAEVTENTAIDNVSGILVFNLPNLRRKEGSRTKVHKNTMMANNRAPFAVAGSIVSYVPPGTGMILLAGDNGEVTGNTISGNSSTGVVIVSCPAIALLTEGAVNCGDALYDPFLEGLYLHDNTFSGNGMDPQSVLPAWWKDRSQHFPDIIWDGITDPAKPDPNGALKVCIKGNGDATFAEIDTSVPGKVVTTDLAAHDCTHASLPGVPVTW